MIEIFRANSSPVSRGPGRPQRYPFDRMAVGDAFEAEASYHSVYSSIRYYRDKVCNGKKCPEFKITKHDGVKKVTVTRVK